MRLRGQVERHGAALAVAKREALGRAESEQTIADIGR
jgi:hypothetical protein